MVNNDRGPRISRRGGDHIRYRRRMRFGRRRQRARSEQVADEDDAAIQPWYRIASFLLPGVQPPTPPWRDRPDGIRPYRGFRAGRARIRPDSTGYDEPLTPDRQRAPDRERWPEPRADDPTLDPILGDEDDEPWTNAR
jgi:hypothetical protein